jgi:hypothetical protein
MAKISIKKNVKPKTIKQKQKQTQNVTVNIGSISKKRGRPKRQSVVKKPTQQPTYQPIVSYNQPIFKQSTPQPSSLASSILATQATPKVVAEEVKNESTLRKALQEQSLQTDEPVTKGNDLERVRSERIKKFEKPSIVEETKKEIKSDEPTRHALLSQLLADQQNDTEEINSLLATPARPDIPFVSSELTVTDLPSFRSTGTQTSRFTNALRGIGLESVIPSSDILTPSRSEQRNKLLGTLPSLKPRFTTSTEETFTSKQPIQTEETYFDIEEPIQEETPLSQPEQRGPAELITETPSEATPLSQPTIELGFGGLSEEPIVTSIGKVLPPEPVSQNELAVKKRNIKLPSLLRAVEPPPPITEAQETAPTILEGLQPNEVRAADQYVNEQLVKDEPAGGAPLAESRIVESNSLIKTPAEQAREKWEELQLPGGPLEGIDRTKPNPKGGKRLHKSTTEWLNDIHGTPGNENWKHIKPENRPPPGPKKKPVVAEEVQVFNL